MGANPVLREAAFCLAHVPELVRYGSKPRREIAADPGAAGRIARALRSYEQAVAYAPNQAYVGNLAPEQLRALPRPWHQMRAEGAAHGRFGEIVDSLAFYRLLARANVLEPPLFALTDAGAAALGDGFESGGDERVQQAIDAGTSYAIHAGDLLVGGFSGDDRVGGANDENLRAHHLLENLCTKASAALALDALLRRTGLAPDAIDYLVSCGEEAVGDRYQRGGGGMAKAIGEMCGCVRASGMDVKNFCAAPADALVTAGALVKAGLYERVAVVAGGSLAKLGMKFLAFLERGIPILEDCLAAAAFLVTADDGESPVLRLEPGAVGIAPIGASTSEEAVYRSLLLAPLETLGLRIPDVDRYAPELHNPEIMEFAGSGDVARKNYRKVAAMAVLAGQLEKSGMDAFIERVGMPGFVPTQGHIPSGVAYLGHASRAMREGGIARAMVLSKASLFLGRVTDLYDGVSLVVERNPRC